MLSLARKRLHAITHALHACVTYIQPTTSSMISKTRACSIWGAARACYRQLPRFSARGTCAAWMWIGTPSKSPNATSGPLPFVCLQQRDLCHGYADCSTSSYPTPQTHTHAQIEEMEVDIDLIQCDLVHLAFPLSSQYIAATPAATTIDAADGQLEVGAGGEEEEECAVAEKQYECDFDCDFRGNFSEV